MMQMTVGGFKTRFSQVITSVMEDEDVEILYGRAKKPVAKVSKLSNSNQKRQIVTYDNIAAFSEVGDSKITLEEFLGI
jgi:antitoxin (DNA-binding transcriptional repressor) of toxin-antitoxin stability system